jgi:hypothetical protein
MLGSKTVTLGPRFGADKDDKVDGEDGEDREDEDREDEDGEEAEAGVPAVSAPAVATASATARRRFNMRNGPFRRSMDLDHRKL